MPRVTFLHPEAKSGEVEVNTSLLEASKLLGFVLNNDCGGNASCTTCRVEVQIGSENLSEIDFDEQDLLDRKPSVSRGIDLDARPKCSETWLFGCQRASGLRPRRRSRSRRALKSGKEVLH